MKGKKICISRDRKRTVIPEKGKISNKITLAQIEKMPCYELSLKIKKYLDNNILTGNYEEIQCENCGNFFYNECPYCIEEGLDTEKSIEDDFYDEDSEYIEKIKDNNFLLDNYESNVNIEERFIEKFEKLIKNREKINFTKECNENIYRFIKEKLYYIFDCAEIKHSFIILPDNEALKSIIMHDLPDESLYKTIDLIVKELFNELNKDMSKTTELFLPGIIIKKDKDGELYQELPCYLPDDIEISKTMRKKERIDIYNILNSYKIKLNRIYYIGEFLIEKERAFLKGNKEKLELFDQKDIINYMNSKEKKSGINKFKIDKTVISRLFSSEYVKTPDEQILPLSYFTIKQCFLDEYKDVLIKEMKYGKKDRELIDEFITKFPEAKNIGVTKKDLIDFRKRHLFSKYKTTGYNNKLNI
ncbi:MAG: hypothetical protein ABRQ38_28100 [Candidatus Eremiobacterota bacterium]